MKTKIEFCLIGLQRLFLIIKTRFKPEVYMCCWAQAWGSNPASVCFWFSIMVLN